MRAHFLAVLPLTLAASLVQAQTLQEAIQTSIESHPEIQAGVNARMAADAAVKSAKGGYLPRVDVLTGYGRESSNNSTTRSANNDKENWETLNRGEASLRLQQMIFDGFATSSEVARQQATANSRAYSLLGTSEKTALNVVQVYLDVLVRREYVRLAEANLKNHERIYDQIVLRTNRGVGRSADLDQAEARLAQARNNLQTEKTNLSDAETNYLAVTGQMPDQLEQPAPLAVPASLDQVREELVANSPVLRSAESDISATEKQYKAAKSTFYPKFTAELERSANNNIGGEEGQSAGWQAMVRMSWNLYAGGSNKADLESKSYQINQALDIRNNALRQLNQELGLAWNAYDNAVKQLPDAKQYVERSERVRQSYQAQFSLGERTLLDLLDSENETFTAQRRLAEVENLKQFSLYRIKAVTGELLHSQGVVAPMASVVQNDIKPDVKLPGMN